MVWTIDANQFSVLFHYLSCGLGNISTRTSTRRTSHQLPQCSKSWPFFPIRQQNGYTRIAGPPACAYPSSAHGQEGYANHNGDRVRTLNATAPRLDAYASHKGDCVPTLGPDDYAGQNGNRVSTATAITTSEAPSLQCMGASRFATNPIIQQVFFYPLCLPLGNVPHVLSVSLRCVTPI